MRKSSDYFFRQALAVILLAGVLWLTAQSFCVQENAEPSKVTAKDLFLKALNESMSKSGSNKFRTNTVIESVNYSYTEPIFRVESDLAGEIGSQKDVFWGLHKFGKEDIVSNLFHNIGQLLEKWLIEVKDTLICSITIYFAVQNLIFKKPKTQKAMVALITTSCFFSGIGYGWLTL